MITKSPIVHRISKENINRFLWGNSRSLAVPQFQYQLNLLNKPFEVFNHLQKWQQQINVFNFNQMYVIRVMLNLKF